MIVPASRIYRLRRRLAAATRRWPILPFLEGLTLLAVLVIALVSYLVISGQGAPERLMSPPLIALLLVGNLVPIMGLMVLIARRVALARAARSELGNRARLHVRLVALFAAIAMIPTLLVVIFASLLFQFGIEFSFSDRARVVLGSAERVAQAYVRESRERLLGDIVPMGGDLRAALTVMTIDDPRFAPIFARQIAYRGLSEAAIISVEPDGTPQLIALANLDKRPLAKRLPPGLIQLLQGGQPYITAVSGDRIEGTMLLDKASQTFLYISRSSDPVVLSQAARARSALSDYSRLVDRSRVLQVRFNIALMIVSLSILGIAILVAIRVADRLVRPVNELVAAARRVAGGDLSARVVATPGQDEIGALSTAFNRMTRKLGEQTGALVAANSQLESRSAFIEAVFSGVTAGIISVDEDRRVTLVNPSARHLLGLPQEVEGVPLADISAELDRFLTSGEREVVLQLPVANELKTLAARAVNAEAGQVLTFDDITQQIVDQRRAAWADVARRIAHEIKNPLTPIQLAAERLQRRYGKEVVSDPSVFEKLTATIVRQVGDMRRIVDEFSSFARMPRPSFREEAIVDIARQALFLHEVANPGIAFALETGGEAPTMICDRRQLGQALTNLVKNAIEAITENRDQQRPPAIVMTIAANDRTLSIEVADNGPGLPAERDRLTEPYMTTRARGTGLGLAIVRKIVEDHSGVISFRDRPGGGTIVDLDFNLEALSGLAGDATDELEAQERLPALTRSA